MGDEVSNRILKALMLERIQHLKLAISCSSNIFVDPETGKLSHPGEYGAFRERAVRDLLQLFMPAHFGMDTGFVITNMGDVSTQCDIVIFDRSITPQIVTDSRQRFFPVEAVVGVGEVKSDVGSPSVLMESLTKLARIKALRERIRNPSPYRSYKDRDFSPLVNPFDHIFTFLICNRLNFEPIVEKLKYDNSVQPRFRHNLILSIVDGLFCYSARNAPPNFHYPTTGNVVHDNKWNKATDGDVPSHFGIFLSALYNSLNVVTLLEPDMALYMSDDIFDYN